MDLKKIRQSKTIMRILAGLSVLIILIGTLRLGIEIGYRRAGFLSQFGDNYHRNFLDPRSGFFGSISERRLPPGGHGAVGKIVSINFPLLVIVGNDNLEKTI